MKPHDTINMIPLIDVMLVLLAVVLMTATFIHYGQIDVEVPEARSVTGRMVEDVRRITIAADGGMFLDDEPVSMAVLEARLSAVDAGTPVVLRVDRDARFAAFVEVIDLLNIHELRNLSIVVRPAS